MWSGSGAGPGDGLAHAEARRGHPVLPCRLGQGSRHGAVTGHTHDHRDEAVIPVERARWRRL